MVSWFAQTFRSVMFLACCSHLLIPAHWLLVVRLYHFAPPASLVMQLVVLFSSFSFFEPLSFGL